MSTKYHVFTRLSAGDDIMHVGTVNADSPRLAKTYAYRTYDEEDWDYMAVVSDDNLIPVEEHSVIEGGKP
ncbi:phenylacetic acid degradation PaaB family protein [Halobacterium noricense]|uniref:phenylacetic acid degradation PaaB family protein n=1 Tax=Halobacterium noricense TaxID=223182 RepID=UPI001E4A5EAD|nr:phenylacetic acid degradation PaaB family protein [Halobacterium noricense]UHH23982.1 phenylacetic acid degradation PaaB family protein [Halobacterium noricense]